MDSPVGLRREAASGDATPEGGYRGVARRVIVMHEHVQSTTFNLLSFM